jgi:hypothetical protein
VDQDRPILAGVRGKVTAMPVKFGLWRVDGTQVQQVPPTAIASEERLEQIIEARLDILGLGNLFKVGRQVITDYGKRIDILAIDGQGDLHIVELKKDRTPREVVAQSLEYGFWVQDLSFEAIRELYAKHHQGDDFDSAFTVTLRPICPRHSIPATISLS